MHFLKIVFYFRNFLYFPKTICKNQIDAKSGKNHISTVYSFIFLHKNGFFYADLFLLVLKWYHPKQFFFSQTAK